MTSQQEDDQLGVRLRPLLLDNPRLMGLPQELVLMIISFALDESRTFDRLVEMGEMTEADKARAVPVEGDDGTTKYWLVRRETWLSRVCSAWKDWIHTWHSVGLHTLAPYELRVTGQQWLDPSFPMLALLSIHAYRPYRKLHIFFSKFVTPPASLDRSETTALLFPQNSNEKQRPEFSSHLTDIHLTLSNNSSIALDAILGAYDFPPRFNIIFTFNSDSQMFLSSFASVQIDTEMHLTFEINSWRAGLGAEVPLTIANIASWIWPSGGVRKSTIEIKLPRDGHEFRGLTKDWKRRSSPSFSTNWDFHEVVLKGFGGGPMVFDFLTCAGIRISTDSLVLITYPMEVCFFHNCHSLTASPAQPDWNARAHGITGLITSPTPTEADAPVFPDPPCPISDVHTPAIPSASIEASSHRNVRSFATSPHAQLQASASLPPSPPLEVGFELCPEMGHSPKYSSSPPTAPSQCHECHRQIDRQPYDLTWISHDPEIHVNHRARSVGILLCEGERLLPLEQYQLRKFEKAGIGAWASEEEEG